MPSFPRSLPPSLVNHVYSAFTHTPIHPNGGIRNGLLSAVIALLSQLCLAFTFSSAMDKIITFLFLLTLFIFSKDGRVTAGFKGSVLASLALTKSTQEQLAFHHNHQNHQDGGFFGQRGRYCMSLTVYYNFTRKCYGWLLEPVYFSVPEMTLNLMYKCITLNRRLQR